MQNEFHEAFFNCRHSVYGYRLNAPCCRHAVILDALKSPIATGSKTKPSDILLAAKVFSSRHFDVDFRLSIRDLILLSFLKPTRQKQKLDAFIADNESYPKRNTVERKRRSTIGAPYPLILVTLAVEKLNVSIAEAWEMPMSQISWYLACVDEMNGGDAIIDGELENQILSELKEAEEIGKQLLEARKNGRSKH